MAFTFTPQQAADLQTILDSETSTRYAEAYGLVIYILETDQIQILEDKERIVTFLKGAQNVNLNVGDRGHGDRGHTEIGVRRSGSRRSGSGLALPHKFH